ncbi:hypothetical protein BN2497_895 [Janthinobacterium sp. CG23_2]|nr:hypothetical protein BN2497_895 [Janthinobacterium sp. CG23_2]CUU26845.1 hypothetical protein BN3177_895 [Janthinobacterium sp. CG23_2]
MFAHHYSSSCGCRLDRLLDYAVPCSGVHNFNRAVKFRYVEHKFNIMDTTQGE